MQRIIEELSRKISLETHSNMTSEQEYYVSGLSDALEIVKKYQSQYVVGKIYYVIVFDKTDKAEIKKMRLYKINQKSKTAYCFTYDNDKDSKFPNCDLVLYNINSMKIRVHNTFEEAEKYKSIAEVSRLEYKRKRSYLGGI